MAEETTGLTKTGVYLHPFHGREEPGQSLEDWGEQGPVLGPFEFAHVTYGEEINLGDDGESLKLVGGLVYYGGSLLRRLLGHLRGQVRRVGRTPEQARAVRPDEDLSGRTIRFAAPPPLIPHPSEHPR